MTQSTRPSTEIERAYAAGFFDGEGTVVMRYRKPCWQIGAKRSNGGRGPGHMAAAAYSPGASIGNSNRIPLEWLAGIWGGKVCSHTAVEEYRPMWYWQRTSVDGVRRFLLEIRPYLQIKAPMADAMLEWLSLTPECRRSAAPKTRELIRDLNGRRDPDRPSLVTRSLLVVEGHADGSVSRSSV